MAALVSHASLRLVDPSSDSLSKFKFLLHLSDSFLPFNQLALHLQKFRLPLFVPQLLLIG